MSDTRLKFKGFPDVWKQGQPASVPGLGSVNEGDVVDVPEELASFLLTSEIWEETDEELTPRQPAELPQENTNPTGTPNDLVVTGESAPTDPDQGAK